MSLPFAHRAWSVSQTELGTIWLLRDPTTAATSTLLFLSEQPDSWMVANRGRGSLAAAAESNALMLLTFSLSVCLPLPLSLSPSLSHRLSIFFTHAHVCTHTGNQRPITNPCQLRETFYKFGLRGDKSQFTGKCSECIKGKVCS